MITIRNSPGNMVSDFLSGYLAANETILQRIPGVRGIAVKNQKDKVKIVIGGGSGCEPMHIGYAGFGMADAMVIGDIFAAPPATQISKAAQYVHSGQGILFITGNYTGDVLNYELASELLAYEGVTSHCVFVNDDIAHQDKQNSDKRRGLLGIMTVIKIAAAAASAGLSLDEVTAIANLAKQSVATISVTFWSGYRPETGVPMYQMKENEISIGMGFNGEPGIYNMEMPTSDQLARFIMAYIFNDTGIASGDEIAMIINGKGATSPMELYIFGHSIRKVLDEKGVTVLKTEVGNYFTAPGMGGVSVTVIRMCDKIKRYYFNESYTPMYSFR